MKTNPVTPPPGTDVDALCVNTLRFLAVDAVEKANSGHPGTPMEAAPLAYVLWTKFMKHNPRNPRWVNRDRFVLSAGHASMLLYGLLHLTGYELSLDEIKNFRQWGSKTPGHPEYGLTPGVETTTGPLGQGFANGVGMAIAERYLAARFNRPNFPVVDYFIHCFASDGDIMEGVGAEAASLAGHLKLGKLKYVYLDNRITIEGDTALALSEDTAARFESYGWEVLRLDEAENLSAIEKVFRKAHSQTERPTLIMARTHIGFGSPNKQDTADAHGSPLGAEEVALTKKALGWPADAAFHVPTDALARYRACLETGARKEEEWKSLFERYRAAHPQLAAELERLRSSPLADGWEKRLPVFKAGEKMATRQASGKVLNAVAPHLPKLMGGSADLAPSTVTLIDGEGDFSAKTPSARNLRFGVREHAMGSILNGMALTTGMIPYGATFLVFTDYMRPAIRLAALSGLGVIFVMTHDSVGLGEDGPTHQPVEHLAALRAIPNIVVFRPADANETAVGWRVALERRKAPTVLVLTRQKLPVFDRTRYASVDGAAKGGYVLSPAPDGKPRAVLIATGSEVAVALSAQDALAKEKISVQVVSMPSWELFEAQPAPYKEEVLPSSVAARLAVEAGVSQGWHRFVGSRGDVVSLERFGESAPGEVALAKLGFNPENVAGRLRALLERNDRS
jgi:transketolase